MNVLSLCDGMSCGHIALKELDIPIDHYYASEIDKNSIKVTMDNFPDTIQLGDVNNITEEFLNTLPKIDLICYGSPCTSLTKATAGRKDYNNGLKGSSGLFYKCSNIQKYIQEHNNKDVKFFVENVTTGKKNQSDIDIMSEILGVKPIVINSNLFSAQDRERNYWTNIDFDELPKNNTLVLKDIMDTYIPDKYWYKEDFDFYGEDKKVCATLHINGHDILKRVNSKYFKCQTLTSCRGGNHQKKVYDNGRVRKLTPNEYMKLQTIPEWYKMNIADTHIYNMCGDGWTIEVIKHIFKGLT